jgi:peptidoglycan/LPS O-acetylase OafA/YrhL
MPQRDLPKHFYSLDVLRGLAALSVVFTHWHMLLSFSEPVEPPPDRLPVAWLLRPFYEQGWRAVDLFFVLSGFIFYWLYARTIREKRITFAKFGVLRLSRLYPLHFATLLLVAAGQYAFHRSTGRFFVYPDNDAKQFVLHLFFVQDWLGSPSSFNGPTWSISIEIGLYAVFFAICRLGYIRWWVWAGLIGVAMVLRPLELLHNEAYRGFVGFFTGCLTFLVFTRLLQLRSLRGVTIVIGVVTTLLWIGASFSPDEHHPIVRLVNWVGGSYVRARAASDPAFALRVALNLCFNFGVFPVTVLLLALVETMRGSLGKRVAFVGDLSYASYLLHFPLMLGVVLVMVHTGFSPGIFYSPITLVVFFAVLVAASILCYRFFEKPAQDAIRLALLGARKRSSAES